MRYSGIQPQYFPRLHYFARILNADIFVSRDDAQFLRKHKYPDGKTDKSYQAHTPIKTPSGIYLLNVPTKHEGFIPIYKTAISYNFTWAEDHLKTIQINYSKSPNFNDIYKDLELILSNKFDTLDSLNLATISWPILYLLGKKLNKIDDLKVEKQDSFRLTSIKKAIEADSVKDFKKFDSLSPNEKIVKLCREFGGDEDYCGGTGATAYIDHGVFEKNGIKITVQDWKCSEYPQLFTKQQEFIPNLSIIDLLMNVSREGAIKILNG